MKILMVSAGLRAKRIGGVPAYLEDLMAALQARGHELLYLDFSGTRRWARTRLVQEAGPGAFPVYTVINSGTRAPWSWEQWPGQQVRSSFRLRRLIKRFIRNQRPDIVHFHELICVPVDLLTWLKRLGCKVMFTSQDFYPVCPTIKLFRYDGLNCTLPTPELICDQCCAHKLNHWELRAHTANARVAHLTGGRWPGIRAWAGKLAGLPGKWHRRYLLRAESYRARRREFARHLQSVDAMVCMSKLHENVMRDILGAGVAIRQLYLSRESLKFERVPPAAGRRRAKGPLVFIALNMVEPLKGAELLYEAFRPLEEQGYDFQLKIYSAQNGVDTPRIQHIARYADHELDRIVADADFGLVPSLWREAYGYVGVEMLSRGLPILVSSRGAMTEYVQHGTNGLVFDPDEPGSLTELVRRLLTESDLRQTLWDGVGRVPAGLPFARHVDEMECLYTEVHAAVPSPLPLRS